MKELHLRAMAKINLGLDVIRKRPDGYHDLRMIMQTVNLFDRIALTVTRTPGIRVETNLRFLPVNENNLVYRAAQLLMEEFSIEEGLFIDLYKHIPVAAGLAGGSSDAAAVLVGMNRMFDLQLSEQELMERGVKLGADIPYCIMRGTALAEGIGEKLTRLDAPPACHVLLAKPGFHVSTKFVYAGLDLNRVDVHPDIDGQIEALRAGDLEKLAALMGNVLETVTVPAFPAIEELRQIMLSNGAAGARMSGSGPTVFGLFREKEDAQRAAAQLRQHEQVRQVFLTEWYPRHDTEFKTADKQ